MYNKKEKKTVWETIGPWIAFFILVYLFDKCSSSGASGPQYPLDQNSESAEYQADQSELDTREYDPALMYEDVAPDDLPEPPDLSDPSSCPNGCTTHINGCDIKGNVSFETGKKIYHLPGQDYYDSTSIDPSYGERWFCTEDEAISNGWRKSYQ